jgi:peptidoglycan/LPS O-acetylase OafA/YrhL
MSTQAAQDLGYPLPLGWEHFTLQVLRSFGVFAVPIFLFVSGSFFAYTAQGNNPKITYRMVWAGLQHLFWPYLLWSIVFYMVIFFLDGTKYSLTGYLKNLLVGYPFHFVPLIVFFYLISPVLVPLIRRFPWAVLTGIAIYQIFLMNILDSNTLGFPFPDWTNYLAPFVIRGTLASGAIFFPLGVIYNLKVKDIKPQLVKYKGLFFVLTLIFFGFSILNGMGWIKFPLAVFLAPIMLVLFLPSVRRESIPLFHQLEKLGWKSYGLYLTNLIMLSLILLFVKTFIPGVLHYQLVILPFLFALTLAIPLVVMREFERIPARKVYKFVFG